MDLLHELKEFRSKINQKLCSDQKIVDLINDKPNSPIPDRDLMYKRIYPYAYTPEAVKDTGTFICHRIYVPDVMNKTFKKMSIVFYVFVHQDNIRTSDGLRYDLIAERIEEMFNGTMEFGVGRMRLVEINDISPAPKFHGISLEYSVSEFNRPTINGDPRAGAET